MSARFATFVVGFAFPLLVAGCRRAAPAREPGRSAADAMPSVVDASTCVAAPLARAPGAVQVVWRTDPFVSAFWAIDHASRWDGETGRSPYAAFFERDLPRAAGDGDMLATYGRLRRRYSSPEPAPGAAPEPDPEPATAIDLLPPRSTPADHFAHAFLCAADAASAARRLAMTAADREALVGVFDHFRARLDATFRRSPFLERAAADMQRLSKAARMEEFLASMARFYGTADAMPSPLYVDVVWGPPGSSQATANDDHMMVPISAKIAGDPKELAGWVGVTVHEFGHQFLAYVSDERRHRISNRIVAAGGLLRPRHDNVVDEATQAALGNLLFMRERLPEGLDERFVYSYEPELPYPDLIDTLARRAEPLVRDALARGDGFDGRYLDEVLAAQSSEVRPMLDHFSHVALLFAGSNGDRAYFDGLFWGKSRFASNDPSDFATSSSRGESLSRWAVLTRDELGARGADHGHTASLATRLATRRDALRATMPAVADAERDLEAPGRSACVRASRRASGAWDVAVVAKDRDALRRVLVAVARGVAPDDAHPLCVP